MAMTKMNLGSSCYFIGRPEESLIHTNAAKDILAYEMQEAIIIEPVDTGYNKKLLLNSVLTLFNRAVQSLACGDSKEFKLNIN